MRKLADALIPPLMLAVWGLVPAPAAADAPTLERVEFDSADQEGFFAAKPVRLSGYLLKSGTARAMAVLAHPCEGLLKEDGAVWPKYLNMSRVLNEAGITVLLVDSFTPRGKRKICDEASKSRSITTETRVKDNLGALAWLAGQADMQGKPVLLVGWGNSAVLETMARPQKDARFAAAVAWYPPCEELGKLSGGMSAPVLVLAGEKDDWNPPMACQAYARGLPAGAPPFEVALFPDTYHSFDMFNCFIRTVRWAGGVSTVGSNPEATREAYARVVEFVSRYLGIADSSKAAK